MSKEGLMAKNEDKRLSRRQVLGTAAAAGAVGTAAGVGLSQVASTSAEAQTRPAQPAPARTAAAAANKHEVKPGELDEYYVFFSSGQTGELRIVGLPSMLS